VGQSPTVTPVPAVCLQDLTVGDDGICGIEDFVYRFGVVEELDEAGVYPSSGGMQTALSSKDKTNTHFFRVIAWMTWTN